MKFTKWQIPPVNKKRLLKRSALALLCGVLIFLILHIIFPLPDKVEYATVITDDKGEVIHAFLTSDQQWRMKTELEEISPLLRKTIIEKEDKYFYYHPGFNPLAVLRAATKNMLGLKRTSGASTITMQVARALEPKRRTYFNKLVEMFRAVQLELKYSKDEILQLYLNLAPYGGNIQGVKAASLLYFKKNPDHLSLAEITALSIIPNRPSSLVPGKSNALIVQERNRWLLKFKEDGLFTDKEIKDALAEPLTATRGAVPQYLPHLSWQLKRQYAQPLIKTHINMHLQSRVEQLAYDYINTLRLQNIRNAAVVVINNQTHRVVGYIGSSNFKDTTDGGQVNGAAAIRQPGSTLKPLLYGMCIDEGLLTPKTIISDVAVSYSGYAPENYDRKFNGAVSMEYALEHSLNIPAVKSLKALGKDAFVNKLAAANFKRIKKDQRKLGLSVVLGGCGATLEELTALYSSFASNGWYQAPSYIQSDSAAPKQKILSEAAAFIINETLSKVNRPDFPLNWQSTEHLPKIAWKTGTSYGRKDAWSIGYNKKYTVGVWVGNFSAQGVPELSGAQIATPLLFRIFNTIDYDSDQDWFTQPAGCDIRKVCASTGLPPNEFCTDIVTDYFVPLISASTVCQHMKEIMVSENEQISYCVHCRPAAGYKKKRYPFIAADMQQWMDDNKVLYTRMPPHNPACEAVFKEGVPSVTAPKSGGEYFISSKEATPLQLRCEVSNDVSKVFWYINNQFYKTATPGTAVFFMPPEGPVKISCTDDKGRNRDIWITVKKLDF